MDRWFEEDLNDSHFSVLQQLLEPPRLSLVKNTSSPLSLLHIMHFLFSEGVGNTRGCVVKDPALLICGSGLRAFASTIICIKPVRFQVKSFLSRGFKLKDEEYERINFFLSRPASSKRDMDSDIALLIALQNAVRDKYDYAAEVSDHDIRLVDQRGKHVELCLPLDSRANFFSIGVKKKMLRKSGVTEDIRREFTERRLNRILDQIDEFQQL